MARPADGMFLELDTAIDANFHAIFKNGGATQNINLGAATVGIHKVTMLTDRGGDFFVWFDGVLFTTLSATGAPANLMGLGWFYRTLEAKDKEISINKIRWTCPEG